jgi:hypothetical protein
MISSRHRQRLTALMPYSGKRHVDELPIGKKTLARMIVVS